MDSASRSSFEWFELIWQAVYKSCSVDRVFNDEPIGAVGLTSTSVMRLRLGLPSGGVIGFMPSAIVVVTATIRLEPIRKHDRIKSILNI